MKTLGRVGWILAVGALVALAAWGVGTAFGWDAAPAPVDGAAVIGEGGTAALAHPSTESVEPGERPERPDGTEERGGSQWEAVGVLVKMSVVILVVTGGGALLRRVGRRRRSGLGTARGRKTAEFA